MAIAKEMTSLFGKEQPPACIPVDIVHQYFSAIEQDQSNDRFHLYGFDKWLNAFSQINPNETLAAAERFAVFVSTGNHPLYDTGPISQLLTRLFREAEEREESDTGDMLRRIITQMLFWLR